MSRALLALCLASFFAVGCHASLRAISTPPPTKSAVLDDGSSRIRISKGVALAFACTTSGGHACSSGAHVDDASIAEVRVAYVDDLVADTTRGSSQDSVYVVVGKASGTTSLHVEDRTLSVQVDDD